jgi:hypothetical protein
MLATAIGMPASNALAAMERPRAIVVVGCLDGLVTIAATAAMMQYWGVLGAAYGGLAGSVVGALGRWLAFLFVARKSQAEAPVDAAVLRLAACGDDAHVQRLGEGDFAAVYLVTAREGGEPVVVKLYRDTSEAGLARDQYEALSRLHACLDGRETGDWRMRIPRPIAVSNAPQALTMSAVPGSALDSGSVDAETARTAGRAFALLMQSAWREGLLHGDLNSSNVLIEARSRTVALIDPGPGVSCTACNAQHIAPAARDLGHLVGELTTDLNDVIGQPAVRLQKQAFVTAALQTAGLCSAAEVRDATLWHLEQTLHPSWSPRGLWHRLVRAVAERRGQDLLTQLASAQDASLCSPR